MFVLVVAVFALVVSFTRNAVDLILNEGGFSCGGLFGRGFGFVVQSGALLLIAGYMLVEIRRTRREGPGGPSRL